ncbi:unnamed protein product [Mycena citricolor]|uniref:AB hydrolase-1 domain-containing protein n=1 Tax=Mycena citricolor TaxID=2018698 RepID=A0AAD2HV03_9AGAR|nr:unnamed protein product [Mycena citricolor]
MAYRIPLLGRLSFREYFVLVAGLLFVVLEGFIHIIILLLPKFVINFCYQRSRSLFHRIAGPPKSKSAQRLLADRIREARDFAELCSIYGYTHEEHVVLTKDGYLLGCIDYLRKKVNKRGNKYSKKSIHNGPNSTKFWDYSMDDFAWHDIPDSINYILDCTKAKTLSYIGFSQGTAQAFAALSIHPNLNEKVNVFVALAPAMSPAGLAASIVDSLMKSSPTLLYLFFGRKSILPSTVMWQSILYPPIYTKVIDTSLRWLFAWRSDNISTQQKLAAYAHLYSFASVKSVVHWFQIMRNGQFQMFDDEVQSPVMRTSVSSYRPARFPTRNIVTPIVLCYGDCDSLVDIDVMVSQLPGHTVCRRMEGYEHLDILWGKDIDIDVIPEVLDALKQHCENPEMLLVNGSSVREKKVVMSD